MLSEIPWQGERYQTDLNHAKTAWSVLGIRLIGCSYLVLILLFIGLFSLQIGITNCKTNK